MLVFRPWQQTSSPTATRGKDGRSTPKTDRLSTSPSTQGLSEHIRGSVSACALMTIGSNHSILKPASSPFEASVDSWVCQTPQEPSFQPELIDRLEIGFLSRLPRTAASQIETHRPSDAKFLLFLRPGSDSSGSGHDSSPAVIPLGPLTTLFLTPRPRWAQ